MGPTPLQIKTKALARLVKEESLYDQEFKDQQALVDKLKADSNTDEYDLKTQIQILEENRKMIPAIRVKIEQHAKDLAEYLKSYDGTEDTTDAKKTLESATKS